MCHNIIMLSCSLYYVTNVVIGRLHPPAVRTTGVLKSVSFILYSFSINFCFYLIYSLVFGGCVQHQDAKPVQKWATHKLVGVPMIRIHTQPMFSLWCISANCHEMMMSVILSFYILICFFLNSLFQYHCCSFNINFDVPTTYRQKNIHFS